MGGIQTGEERLQSSQQSQGFQVQIAPLVLVDAP